MAYGAILHIIQTVFFIKILNHKYITFKLQHAYFKLFACEIKSDQGERINLPQRSNWNEMRKKLLFNEKNRYGIINKTIRITQNTNSKFICSWQSILAQCVEPISQLLSTDLNTYHGFDRTHKYG